MRIPLSLLARRAGKRRNVAIQSYDPRQMDQVRLMRIYMRVVNHWSEARGRLLEAYALTYAEEARYRDTAFTYDAIDDLQSAVDQEGSWFTRLFIELRAEITAWAVATEQWQRGKWRGAVLSATGVDLDTQLFAGDVETTVESRILANLELIKDVDQQQRQRMANVIFQGLNQRLPAVDVAKQLQEVTGFGRKRALLISSVELQKISTALANERAYQAGLGPRYEWVHSGKKHPREWHKARNGKIFNNDAKPGDDDYIPPDDRPGIPIRCGCRSKWILDLEDDDE